MAFAMAVLTAVADSHGLNLIPNQQIDPGLISDCTTFQHVFTTF